MKFICCSLFCVVCMFSCNKNVNSGVSEGMSSQVETGKILRKKAKNIIFLIGDGMGLSQISAGMYSNTNYTSLEQFKSLGLAKTYSGDNLITDSAAAATALACGVKTYNGAIGVDMDTLPISSILEEAVKKSYKTGLIATSSITHATPASFIAHNYSRKNDEAIASDFLKTNIDIFIGGGYKYFSRRDTDDRDLIYELEKKNYVVKTHIHQDIENISMDKTKNFVFFTADEQPLPVSNGRNYLVPAVDKTLDYLSTKASSKGFFLMIEGSQIDWGGHANNGAYVTSEFHEFDQVIANVMKFAREDKETLVVVTADHETGGLAIQHGSKLDSLDYGFTSDYHTATMVPIFSYGPQSSLFQGIMENTDIYHRMKQALGWEIQSYSK